MTDDEKRELIAEAREWVQEENWESDHERAGFNRPGTGLIARLADALEGTLTEPNFDAMRIREKWPTPNHMRRAADALDEITPARYSGVLRWFADRCDEMPVGGGH